MLEVLKNIPEFPEFKEIALEDKPLFNEIFTRFPPVISEFTFTNLFMWRYAYQLKVSRLQNFLCLLSDKEKDPFFFPMIGEGDVIECYRMLLQYLEKRGSLPRICRVPETVVSQANWEAAGMAAKLDLSQCDYVYLARDLILLQGRKYHRKRNHIKQFKGKYSYQYVSINPEWIPECLRMEREWCNLRNCEIVPGLANESVAIKEIFTHFDELRIKGGAILIDGKVEAFTFGEPLNPETVVIHIEKANSDYEGLYAVINQAFLENHWSGFQYVNREQDLGEEGLRKAKESYFPHHRVNKYTIGLQ
jgi:hypothetical protein